MYPPADVNYVQHHVLLRTPAYRHLAFAITAFLSVLLVGTTEIAKVVASNQVVYKPTGSLSKSVILKPQSTFVLKSQSAVSPPVSNHSAAVQTVLNSWGQEESSQQWSVVVQGLGNDQTNANINAQTPYDTASVYKLFLMYPLFKNYSMSSLADASIKVDGRGPENLKTCVQLAIQVSDNPCGDAIGYQLGWGKSTTLLEQIGMDHTNLNSLNGMTTTAGDTALFLQKLDSGQLMAADEQQFLVGLMQQQVYRSGIPAGCNGCTVADKIGDLGYVRHDVSIVQYNGEKYILVIMTNGASYAQIAQLTGQIQDIMKS